MIPTNKHIHVFLLLALLSSLVCLLSCSDDRTKPDYSSHTDNWVEFADPGFHGRAVVSDHSFGYTNCLSCHGVYADGGSSGVSCFDCHAYPHSGVEGWSAGFHGNYITRSGPEAYATLLAGCKKCHGQNLDASASPLGTPIPRKCADCHTD
jgi:hypothetical protein